MSKKKRKKSKKDKNLKKVNVKNNNENVKNKDILTEDTKKVIQDKNEKKIFFKDSFVFNLIFLTVIFFLIEVLFKAISNFQIFSYESLRILISSFFISLIVNVISNLFNKRWVRNTINLIFVFVYTVYTWIQLGFINYLGVYISFNTSSQFGAVKDYIFDYLTSFKPIYYVIFLPFIFAIVWYILLFKKKKYQKITLNKNSFYIIPTLASIVALYYLTLTLPFMQNELQTKSNLNLFRNPNVPTLTVNQFGTTVFGLLDLKSFLLPVEEKSHVFNVTHQDETITVKREVSNTLNLIAEQEDDKFSILNQYFASQKVTDVNNYTGMFENKNVVVILMESVNEAIINEELFPNFYNLYSNGWSFENTYSPRNSCATGNNEFSALTGLYSIYNTCTANVYKNNTYFESIFNLFNNKGYTTTSMHNFTEWYYYRSTIHKNMGSGKYYGANDLDIKTAKYYGEWPSDVEFFEKAFDIILNSESDNPWMTWLTTVTSHQPYSSSSTYGDMYKDYFIELGYSVPTSRYLSKLKVVDEAIGVMINKLKEKEVFDDTVIVLLADHYPYGLNEKYISEMITHDLKDYDIEKTPFVIYNSKIEPKVFSQYSSYINLVPTIANLMNLNYDPRYYMGNDLLSGDYESRVVFADGSWKNEYAYYNASTSKIKYYTDFTYTNEEIQEINNTIDLKISMSSSAIKRNYFKYLEDKINEYENPQVDIESDIEE